MNYKEQARKRKGWLGLKLKSERKRLGISLLDFWAITDWDSGDVSNFERNAVNEDMKLSTYLKVTDLLDMMKNSKNKREFADKLDH